MTLALDIKHRLGAFELDAQFETAGGLVALFGRSGSGKTSIINIIAGLIRPDRGRVAIDDFVLVDTARGVFVRAATAASAGPSPSRRASSRAA